VCSSDLPSREATTLPLLDEVFSYGGVTVENVTKSTSFECRVMLAPRQRKILADGGLLNHTRKGK